MSVVASRAVGPAVEVRGLGKRFALVEALRDVTFSLEPGEFLAVIGPSGCGKTTLLHVLAGLERPTAGEVRVAASSAAMVFQGRSLFPWYTVRRNVEYGLAMRRVPADRRRGVSDRLIETVGLSRFADAYPSQLSEGMRQRVGIARALAIDPDVLLMDEPFANLDEQNRLLMQEELLRIWGGDTGHGIPDTLTPHAAQVSPPGGRGKETRSSLNPESRIPNPGSPGPGSRVPSPGTSKTVLFVTHSLEEAVLLADRVLVMTAQPGTIKAALGIPFGRPRDFQVIRRDPAYGEITARLWDLLRDEVVRAGKR